MTRDLSSFLPVAGDPTSLRERFLADPDRWLPRGSRRAGRDVWSVPLRFHGIVRNVRLTIGAPWVVGSTAWRAATWLPEPHPADPGPLERMLPAFQGELALHGAEVGCSLVLVGHYEPPGARLGELADAVLLHRVAERTGATLLSEIGAALGASNDVPATAEG